MIERNDKRKEIKQTGLSEQEATARSHEIKEENQIAPGTKKRSKAHEASSIGESDKKKSRKRKRATGDREARDEDADPATASNESDANPTHRVLETEVKNDPIKSGVKAVTDSSAKKKKKRRRSVSALTEPNATDISEVPRGPSEIAERKMRKKKKRDEHGDSEMKSKSGALETGSITPEANASSQHTDSHLGHKQATSGIGPVSSDKKKKKERKRSFDDPAKLSSAMTLEPPGTKRGLPEGTLEKTNDTNSEPNSPKKAKITYAQADAETGQLLKTSKVVEIDEEDAEVRPEAKRGDNVSELASGSKKDAAAGYETDPRLPRTLFVGNVSQKATQKDIKKLFKPFGKVETVRMRGVVPVNPKIPKRTALLTNRLAEFSDSFQAYVVFKEAEDINTILEGACQKLNMTVFKERHIRVMPASQKRQGPRKLSLFLGNLPFDCSEEELLTAFKELTESLGVQILNVRVNRDKDTGVGRGVGFITFSDSLGVQGCINAMGEVKIRDRVVRMEPASKMKKTNTKTYRRSGPGSKGKSAQTYWKGAGSKYLSKKRGM